jgi:hypothetical protein
MNNRNLDYDRSIEPLYEILRQLDHILLPMERAENDMHLLWRAVSTGDQRAPIKDPRQDIITARNLLITVQQYAKRCLEERYEP